MPRGSELRVVYVSSQEMCIGEWLVTFFQSIGPVLCFLLQRYTCVPQATSYESRRHLYGDYECACMPKFVPVSLAVFTSAPKIALVVVYVVYFVDCCFDACLYIG